jgi:LacI family transcriptional regulator
MPNQRAIARAAGVSQATVSKALRGMPTIPLATRERIASLARSLDYRPNAYVSTLMTHIRSGRPPRDKGCIAVLADSSLESGKFRGKGAYVTKLRFDGIRRRAEELGFTTEFFYPKPSHSDTARLIRTLEARGIVALILTALRTVEISHIALPWEKFASVALDDNWATLHVDQVTSHRHYSVDLALSKVLNRGYRRLGMCLPPGSPTADRAWKERFLLWQFHRPASDRIPIFMGTPETTSLNKFRSWLSKWKPDVILSLVGHEMEWLESMGTSLPGEIGLVCLNRPPTSDLSGVEDKHEVTGATVVDLVVAQVQRNEFGLPPDPKLILIEGIWKEGSTLRPE